MTNSNLQPAFTTRTTCRACGSAELTDLFSLGDHLVSDFPDPDREETGVRCPIDVVTCRACTLVQQRHTARQDLMWGGHYWYRSGVTSTMRHALRAVTAAVEDRVKLERGDVVLDIGSNDGTLLRSYVTPDLVRIGCEPAKNMVQCYRTMNKPIIHLIPDFWSANAYRSELQEHDGHGMAPNAKVITAIGMLYDLEDPGTFIADVARVLRPDGVFVAQLMMLKNMLVTNDVGNLCHEHLEFWTLRSLSLLLDKHGLEIFDVETNQTNGESHRLWIRHAKPEPWTKDVVEKMGEAYVRDHDVCKPELVQQWFLRAKANRDKVVNFIVGQVAAGKRVWVMGASTKGNTLLQFFGLDHQVIEAAADASPDKHGRVTVGTRIPIRSVEDFRRAKPDLALILPWPFTEEIIRLNEDWLIGGGRFIQPLPQPLVISRNGRDTI